MHTNPPVLVHRHLLLPDALLSALVKEGSSTDEKAKETDSNTCSEGVPAYQDYGYEQKTQAKADSTDRGWFRPRIELSRQLVGGIGGTDPYANRAGTNDDAVCHRGSHP